ncbi:MAG TPA: peptide chain release factor 1, partial [Novosphingobium sp.]|nr:peptide chain release factor 1 [Novosphingobium sp.]
MTVSDARLQQIAHRFTELEARLASGTLEGDMFVEASRDYAELEPVARVAASVAAMRAELASLSQLKDADPD